MTPARTFKTKRLRLTPLTWQDEPFFFNLHRDPDVRRFLGGSVARDQLPHRFRASLNPPSSVGLWAMRPLGSGLRSAIGLIVLAPHHNAQDYEVSYQLLPRFWRMGYAAEAVGAVIEHALTQLALPCVRAETQSANHASCRLLRQIGMHEIETLERFGQPQTLFETRAKSDPPCARPSVTGKNSRIPP